MGNENSKDGEGGAEQPGAEGPSGSEKDTESKLPNGDVGTSSGKSDEAPEGPTPEDGGEPKEPSDVDDHTKRMTIISENVYHYVGIVAGRHYAREKGLLPKAGDFPVAPRGFLRPVKKNQDAKANEGKAVGESGKPDIDGPKETPKEANSPVMELPRFYQSQGEDTNKATEQSAEPPDASDSKAEDKEKGDSGKPAKVESKTEDEVDTAVEMKLPRFYQSPTADKKKAPDETLKPTDVSKSEAKNKTEETSEKKGVENKEERVPEREGDVNELELPRFNQSDESKSGNESGKSEFQSANNGKTEVAGKDKPDKEVRMPATKIPRFYQSPNEEIKKTGGESGKSDVPNGISESKTQEKRGKVDAIETTNMALPRFYQPPGQDKTRTHEELSDKSETQKVPNGDTKAKTEEKNGKLDNNREKDTKELALPRFYSADITEDRPEDFSDSTSERYTTALTVGPRSRRLEEPKRKTSVTKNSIYVGSTKNEEDKTEEHNVEEKTVQKEEETKLKKEKSLELLEEANDPKPKVTETRSLEKKEKIVRFDDLLVEDTAPLTEKKRITSMMTIIAPVRTIKSDDGPTTCYSAPVELTSTPPPAPVSEESRTVNDDDVDYDDDLIAMCGEELIKADRRRRGFNEDEYDIVNTIWDAEEDKTQQQQEEGEIPGMSNQGKDQTMNSQYDAPDANEEIITRMVASRLHSSATILGRQSPPQRTHDVQEDAPAYDVHHLKQPLQRSPEVDLGSGKILNAPSILMGSSITLSANRQKCETLPGDGPVSSVGVKTKSASKEVRLEAPKRFVSRATGTASPDDSVDDERASTIGTVHASVEPSVMDPLDGGKNRCDNYTQTPEVAREDEPKGAPPLVRSRSVGFQCGVGEPKRSIAIQKRPSLPSDSRPDRPPETDKKTRIPLATRSPHPEVRSAQTLPRSAHTETRSAHPEPRVAQPEARRGKGSPLPERKISVLRKGTPTNKTSPRTPPATNDSKKPARTCKKEFLTFGSKLVRLRGTSGDHKGRVGESATRP